MRNYKIQETGDPKELINENLDLMNTFSLLGIKNSDSSLMLQKVKSIVKLILRDRRIEYLKNKCMQHSNGGKKVKVGSVSFQDYRVTSVTNETQEWQAYAVLVKYVPKYKYASLSPDTIKSFSLTRSMTGPGNWENKAEINILGNFDKEYNVKINFFTRN